MPLDPRLFMVNVEPQSATSFREEELPAIQAAIVGGGSSFEQRGWRNGGEAEFRHFVEIGLACHLGVQGGDAENRADEGCAIPVAINLSAADAEALRGALQSRGLTAAVLAHNGSPGRENDNAKAILRNLFVAPPPPPPPPPAAAAAAAAAAATPPAAPVGGDSDNDDAPAPPPHTFGLDLDADLEFCLNVSFDDRYPESVKEDFRQRAQALVEEGGGGGNGSGGRQKVRIDYRNEATGEEGSAEVDTNDDDAMSSEPRRRIRWCRTIARRLANDHNWQLKDTVVEVDDAISTLSNRSDPATIAATTPATPTAAAAAAQGGAVPRRRKPRLPATIHFDYRNRKTGEESSHSAVQTNDVRSCHSAAPITLFLPICTSILFYFD
jgi:hypothetical protein